MVAETDDDPAGEPRADLPVVGLGKLRDCGCELRIDPAAVFQRDVCLNQANCQARFDVEVDSPAQDGGETEVMGDDGATCAKAGGYGVMPRSHTEQGVSEGSDTRVMAMDELGSDDVLVVLDGGG